MNLKLEKIKVFIRRWSLFLIYCAAIYVSLPFAPRFWEAIVKSLGEIGQDLPDIISRFAGAVIIFIFLLLKKRHVFRGLLLICFAFFILFKVLDSLEFLAEKMHVIEYGVLPFIIYRSVNKKQPKEAIYFKILAIGFVVGAIDEVIQRFIPGRVFDIRDIFLNAASVSLGQILLYSLKHLS